MPFLEAFDKGIKRAVLVWHRRSGKDKTLINLIAKKAFERVGSYYYFFPTYKQGRKIIWDGADKNGFRFIEHFPKALIESKNDVEMKIRLKNGSLIQVIGTDNIDSIVGTNPVGCVFSEYSLQDPQVWDFIRPILAENDGWAVFIYTPRGRNHGWKLLQQAKESNWFWQVLTVDQTKAISQEALEEERRQMPEELFRQEYYCDFVDGAAQFFRRVDENIYEGFKGPSEGHFYQLGVDLAKYLDWTVITPFDLSTFRAGSPEAFQKMDYNLQKSRIEASAYRFNGAKIVLDSTGVGEPVFDDLVARSLNVESFKFTQPSRENLLNNLRILIEQDRIKIPNTQELLDQIKSVQYEMTDRGTITIGVPEGLHDDYVMSLALSVWGVTVPVPVGKGSEFNLYGSSYN